MRVSELMHTPAVTCRPEVSIAEVARLMGDRNVGSVVVVLQVANLSGRP
jgi:signal-transduction protein with cAMP-binding, CBS, and nucleotidyltransferase domain